MISIMNHYKKKIDGIVMTMDMKMEGITHLIKTEVKDVMITADHIMKDS